MKASFALVLAGSLLAVASPIKRNIHTDYVTDIVYVTVTVDPPTTTKTSSTHTTLPKTTTLHTTKSTPKPTTLTPTPTPIPTPTPTPTPEVAQVQTITLTQSQAPPAPPAPETTTAAVKQAAVQAPVAAAQPSTPAAQAAPSEPTDYSSAAVYHHNIHRSNHSAPAASWDSDLASYAAQVAASCVFAHDMSPGSSTGPYGQNIAVYGATGDVNSIDTSTIIAQAITNMWYNSEISQFPSSDYGESTPDMSNFDAWGHYSQVIWAASTQVGCASQYCPAGTIYSDMASWFSVCDYRSEGNMGGEYGTNVLPPLGAGTVTV